ncbi:hypothetical protein [Nannocystis sp. SCPEA4]|uniref:hypothetical protein n=1 Tax=Nannocystis sp. SCPEA4 TaxID=2996787 RepID=UPI00226E4A44|nr:hypothetical protein [Nannocystis sp. SCPEA4]MCY1055631.1 hypothetical protein [Nannocystis sp. SCPEA4]
MQMPFPALFDGTPAELTFAWNEDASGEHGEASLKAAVRSRKRSKAKDQAGGEAFNRGCARSKPGPTSC